ncbi:MAG: type II secretion system protein J [Acidimicrobiales bacterium]
MTAHGEEGFTLIELLASTAVMLIIGGALSASLVVGLRSTDVAATRVAESTDAHLLSSYFESDVQSSDDVSIADTFCGGVTPIVRFKWLDPGTSPSTVNYSSYAIETGSGETRLVRRHCAGTNPTPTDKTTVARYLLSAPSPPPCSPDPCRPATVTLALTDGSGVNTYSYSVTGTRRVA